MEPERSLLKEFLEGGWVIPLVGAAGMLARLMTAKKQYTIIEQLKNIISAAIAAAIAWFILEQDDISSFYKAITYGIVGVISPEIINGIIKLAKHFERTPEKFIKKP
jgi:uncharacterized membrane protein YeaQ/YmgE (transglycosylase-associated protein family)